MNDTKTVKNVSGEDLFIPYVGVVKAGETVEVPANFHNANFEVETKKEQKSSKKGGEVSN